MSFIKFGSKGITDQIETEKVALPTDGHKNLSQNQQVSFPSFYLPSAYVSFQSNRLKLFISNNDLGLDPKINRLHSLAYIYLS